MSNKKKVQCFHFGPLAAAAAVQLTFGGVRFVPVFVCVLSFFFDIVCSPSLLLFVHQRLHFRINAKNSICTMHNWSTECDFKNINKTAKMERSHETHSSTFIHLHSFCVTSHCLIHSKMWAGFSSSLSLYLAFRLVIRMHFEFEFEHPFDISLSYKAERPTRQDRRNGVCVCYVWACECVRYFDSFQIKSNMIAKFKEICLMKIICRT